MKPAIVCFWYGNLSDKVGLQKDQIIEPERVLDELARILSMGYWVMLHEYKTEDNEELLLFAIDTCPFRQR